MARKKTNAGRWKADPGEVVVGFGDETCSATLRLDVLAADMIL
jgi:hypothetical protein